MNHVALLSPELDKEKGGIQNWMHFVIKLLKNESFKVDTYAYKEDEISKLKKVYFADTYLLATWKMAIFIFPIVLFTKKKIFIFVHGNEILKLNRITYFFLSYLCKRINTYFIANSHSIGDLFYSVTKRRIDLIQHPFMDIVRTEMKDTINQHHEFLTLTRLVKRKNIDRVLKAFCLLKNEDFSFSYTIAGAGSEMEYLQEYIKELSLDDEVKLLGKVSDIKKQELYTKADYFILPSLFDEKNASVEGYGIVFIEANAYGLPVLSGNTGGMTEAVKDKQTGLHSDGSIGDIKDKILMLCTMDFNRKIIMDHAEKHHYLDQELFVTYLKEKIYA